MKWKQAVSIAVMLVCAVPWLVVNTSAVGLTWVADRIYNVRWGVHRWANPQLYGRRMPRREV